MARRDLWVPEEPEEAEKVEFRRTDSSVDSLADEGQQLLLLVANAVRLRCVRVPCLREQGLSTQHFTRPQRSCRLEEQSIARMRRSASLVRLVAALGCKARAHMPRLLPLRQARHVDWRREE